MIYIGSFLNCFLFYKSKYIREHYITLIDCEMSESNVNKPKRKLEKEDSEEYSGSKQGNG